MNRRAFMEKITGSSAVAWIVAGQVAAHGAPNPYPNPVPFVQDAAAAGLNAADVAALFNVNPAATADQQAQTFPQSVASGDPTSNGVVLWTRVDPNSQVAGDQIAWQIAADPAFAAVLTQGTSTLTSATDNTAKLPVSAPGILQPFTTYYYRFIYNTIPSRTGRFKTLPLPTDSLPELKIRSIAAIPISRLSMKTSPTSSFGTITNSRTIAIRIFIPTTTPLPTLQTRRNPLSAWPPIKRGPNMA